MKHFFTLTLLLGISFCFTTCKKDGPSASLPPATQEGKNTIGFKVNGKVWTPYSACSFSANPCGALNMQYNLPNAPAFYLSLGGTRKYNGEFTAFGVSCFSNTTISTLGNKYDSINIGFTNYAIPGGGFIDYTKSYLPSKGNFTITKIDYTNKIISGTFDCTLYSAADSVVITEGRFDCNFYTCLCN